MKPALIDLKTSHQMDEVGNTIANLCNVIPDGIVCFFPSFTYLDQVYKRWATINNGSILQQIEKRKKVFKEPRESNQVETTLREYAMQIDSPDKSMGALLLCVVNGKMSEGINFSDSLGRGVIMIGLPFANRGSVELIEKIKYAQQYSVNNAIQTHNELNANNRGRRGMRMPVLNITRICVCVASTNPSVVLSVIEETMLLLFYWTRDMLHHVLARSCPSGLVNM